MHSHKPSTGRGNEATLILFPINNFSILLEIVYSSTGRGCYMRMAVLFDYMR